MTALLIVVAVGLALLAAAIFRLNRELDAAATAYAVELADDGRDDDWGWTE